MHFSREFQQFVREKEDLSQPWSLGWIFLKAIQVLNLWDPRLNSGFVTFPCSFLNLAIIGPGRWSGETQDCKMMHCMLDTVPHSKWNSHPSRCRVIQQLCERRFNLFLKPWIFEIWDLRPQTALHIAVGFESPFYRSFNLATTGVGRWSGGKFWRATDCYWIGWEPFNNNSNKLQSHGWWSWLV